MLARRARGAPSADDTVPKTTPGACWYHILSPCPCQIGWPRATWSEEIFILWVKRRFARSFMLARVSPHSFTVAVCGFYRGQPKRRWLRSHSALVVGKRDARAHTGTRGWTFRACPRVCEIKATLSYASFSFNLFHPTTPLRFDFRW